MSQQSNILIVEDRADWQDIVSSTISAEGYSPRSVDSYDSAIHALSERSFDLAVIDPVLDTDRRINRDGLTVIQKISEMQPGTPLVIITGSLTPDIQTSLNNLCPKAPVFLKESWNPADFLDKINLLVSEKWPDMSSPQSAQVVEQGEPTVKKRPTPPANGNAGYPRILLVENNETWQTIVAEVLDEKGCYWRTAYNGHQALEMLDSQSFNVAILDLKLKNSNLPLRSHEGWLLLDHLSEHHPKVKVIVLSGRASATDVAHLLTQYSSVRFIEKQNFTLEALRETLNEVTKLPELNIRTLGQFRISRNGTPVGVIDPHEVETVIKFLLARRARSNQPVAADELITRLWPDLDEEESRKRLLPAINAVRLILEPDVEPRDSNFILRSDNGYHFDLSQQVNWDLMRFRQHAEQAQLFIDAKNWDAALVELEQGQRLYSGDFLAGDSHIDWVNEMRREIMNEYCELMTNLADVYGAIGKYHEAINVCERILVKDPLLEGVYRRLMRYNYCLGQKQQALKAYRDCLKLFEELFGEGPASLTKEIHQKIINDEQIDCPGLA